MSTEADLLLTAESYLREEVGPRACQIDLDEAALAEALEGLVTRGLMALKCPREFGGPGLSEAGFRSFQESVGRYSGTLAFLQTQQQSAVSLISGGDNAALKSSYLPDLSGGRRRIGIGISQLRRPGDPIMRAAPVDGGYVLNGTVPWVTGLGFYDEFIIGAKLPDGRAILAPVPLMKVESDTGAVRPGKPMKLAAMEAAATVSVEVTDWELNADQIIRIIPGDWVQRNDMINITLQGFFALGCARAGLDVVLAAAEKRGADWMLAAYRSLDTELESCRAATIASQPTDDETTKERLEIRAWAIELAARCAHAAVTVSSGAANSLQHPAQRIYREALVFTVSAQTGDVMRATLERLLERRPESTPW